MIDTAVTTTTSASRSPSSAPALDPFGLEILTREECLRLLGHATIGRVGFVDDEQPVILPVNITLWESVIAFRTAPGTKLAAATMAQPAAIEIDGFDDLHHCGWSVLVKGTMATVTEGREIDSLDRIGAMPWSRPDLRHTWVQVRAEQITGRRIAPPADVS